MHDERPSRQYNPGPSRVESADVTKVFLLAVAASLDAVLVATVVLLLGRPRPQRQLLAFWLGAFGLSITFGLVIVLALGRPGLRVNQNGSASPEIEIAAGVVLLAIAMAVGSGLTDRLKSNRSKKQQEQDSKHRPSLADRIHGSDSAVDGVAGRCRSGVQPGDVRAARTAVSRFRDRAGPHTRACRSPRRLAGK
jgi:hypothetical protein